jgi:excisionase family DNA binding protein
MPSPKPAPKKPVVPVMMSLDEVATYANVCRLTVHRLVKKGAVHHAKIGRRMLISKASVDRLLGLDQAA